MLRVEPSLKYAVVERERRLLLAALPEGVGEVWEIDDLYVVGTRLRLREVRRPGPPVEVTRKLTHKVRLGDDAAEVACTNLYLGDAEWAALQVLGGHRLTKRRHHVHRDGWHLVVDEFVDGTLLAEVDDGDAPPRALPTWLDVVREVSADEAWTGGALARRLGG